MIRVAATGRIELYYLDESGFVPTLPTTYTWARVGLRPLVPYEACEGRRVNGLGALAPLGPHAALVWHSRTGTLNQAVFLEFVWREVAGLPASPEALPPGYYRERPCVLVLDNYSVHHGKTVKAAADALARAGVVFFYLPPYSPELNPIERLWRHGKYEVLQVRSYGSLPALHGAVDGALATQAAHLPQSTIHLCEAA